MREIPNNNKINYLILILSFFILVYSINSSLGFTGDHLKHWSTYNKDDIAFVYNSLLYSEGVEPHHKDHPSLFTFIIFPIFYKIAFYFGYIDFYNITSFLKSDDINLSLSKLFYISRFVIQIFSIGIIVLIYKITSYFSLRSIDALSITGMFIISTGFSSASDRIESGLIAIFFILLAFFFFIKFIKKENKKYIFYLILSFLMIFSGMMQKKIVYFVIPFLFASSVIFFKKNEVIYQKYNLFNLKSLDKYLLTFFYFIVFIFIYLKTIDNNTVNISRDLDFIFLIINFLVFNLVFYLYIKKYQNNYFENLLTYNLLFVSTYLFYKYFLIYVFFAPIDTWSITFTNFLGHISMFAGNEEIRVASNLSSINIYTSKLLGNLNLVVSKYFLSFTYQSILVWFNLFLFIIFFNKISFKKRFSFLVLFFGFFIIQSIILFRYEQNTYYLNSEFFLLFSLSLLLNNIKNKLSYFSLIGMLIITLFYSNIDRLNLLKEQNLQSYCYLFKNFESADGFYEYFTNKIPKDKRKLFCIDRSL